MRLSDRQSLTFNLESRCSLFGSQLHQSDLLASLQASHPGLLSGTALYVAPETLQQIRELVSAVTAVTRLPAWQSAALIGAPDVARTPARSPGLFLGFDFHLSDAGPQLIEINTNPGGAFVNAFLTTLPHPCAAEHDLVMPATSVEHRLVDMFRREWSYVAGAQPLTRVAIVDDDPKGQFLFPEFEMAAALLRRAGIDVVIADASSLTTDGKALFANGLPIDLVYNRSTDFYFDAPEHQALKHAVQHGTALVAPHPHAHACVAAKTGLIRLSDPRWLAEHVHDALVSPILRAVPKTTLVTATDGERLWNQRHDLFFKPVGGYGGKAAYRGDKLTKRVFAEILQRPYVAQALVPPSHRTVLVDGTPTRLKVDLRAYAYEGEVLLLAARLYQGQTTNFRTKGGGFATVLTHPAASDESWTPSNRSHGDANTSRDEAH